MGEFLLSILGFDPTNKHLIYTKHSYRAKWKVGDKVALANPNPKREKTHQYYRIYDKFYPVDVLHALVHTQDPNMVDRNDYTPKQRAYEDKQMAEGLARGTPIEALANHYGWHTEAVKLAVSRHRARTIEVNEVTPEVADMNSLEYYNPDDTPLEELKPISARAALELERWS